MSNRGTSPSAESDKRMQILAIRLLGDEVNVPYAVWMKVGDLYQGQGHYLDAFRCYKSGFENGAPSTNSSGIAKAVLGVALEKESGSVDAAVDRLYAALGVSPENPTVADWWGVGRHYDAAQKFQKAEFAYRRAKAILEEISGKQPEYYRENFSAMQRSITWLLAQCLVKTGQLEEAAPLLRRLVKENGATAVKVCTEIRMQGKGYPPYPCDGVRNIRLGSEAAKLLKKIHSPVDGKAKQ